jgi:hypothetical protein
MPEKDMKNEALLHISCSYRNKQRSFSWFPPGAGTVRMTQR